MKLDFFDEREICTDKQVFNKHIAGYVIKAVLKTIGISIPVSVSLNIIEPERIRAVNKETRGLDEVTDVLSFPMLHMPLQRSDIDPDTGTAFLGDILINAKRVTEQSLEYGNTLEREFCYLTAHGMLHLLGYDHMNDDEKRIMREAEEAALVSMGFIIKDLLVSKALKAMERAYAPYSHYAVGACLISESGALYTGSNVENASYGLTICAECTAVVKAVSAGEKRFTAIAIAARGSLPYPCGACRQVLNEFTDNMRVIVIDAASMETKETSIGELLPHAFGPESL